MNITLHRMENETQADYKIRRAAESEQVKTAIYGARTVNFPMGMPPQHGRQLPLSTRPPARPKAGKAAEKLFKRGRIIKKLAAQPHSMR